MRVDDDTLFAIVGICIIFLIILYMIGFIHRSTADDYPETACYADPGEFNNGDLVFVSYNSIAGAIVTSFSSSIWSHTGTIWVDPVTNVRFVLEGAIYKHKKYHHFFKIPLDTWLFFNKRFLIGWKRYIGPQIDSTFLWSKFEWLHKNCKLEAFNVFWSRFLINKDHYEYSRLSKYTCLEATVILGQEAGIYKKDKIYCSYFPGNLVNDEIKFASGVSYTKPIKITIDPARLLIMKEDMRTKFWSE